MGSWDMISDVIQNYVTYEEVSVNLWKGNPW